MNEKFYLGRYALVIPCSKPKTDDNKINNSKLLTNSECISTILPSWWMLNWSLDCKKERKNFSDEYDIDSKTMDDLCLELTKLFDDQKIGYPNVCFEIETAKYLYTKYFSHIDDVKLISIGLLKEESDRFIEDAKPQGENMGELGLYQSLKNNVLMDSSIKIGYKILGYEFGILHSIFCDNLESQLYNRFGVNINRYGLYDSYEDALNASNYISNESDAEPALWQPWVVCEHSLI